MSTVYAPQQPSRYDPATKLWVPTVNLTPAKRYGDLEIIFPPGASTLAIAPVLRVLRERMRGYLPTDFLLAVGDPVLIAAAAMIASRNTAGHPVQLLKWDRMASDYLLVSINP